MDRLEHVALVGARVVDRPHRPLRDEDGARSDLRHVVGQVEAVVDGQSVRTVGRGGFVGEMALLFDVPRTATVRALTPVRAFRLDREGFDGLVADAFKREKLRPAAEVERTLRH